MMELGEMEATTGDGFTTWTVAEADKVESVALVAVIVSELGEGAIAGAV
ncbi:MAG TPA: hypothetical protein VG028_10600 [Terriglobia bacterium]|nr:hypothetical protein [Terriglobia bacterium]